MRRILPIFALAIGFALVACSNNSNNNGTPAPGTGATPTAVPPTSTPLAQTGAKFPVNTLLIAQANVQLAQLPNRQTIALTPDRMGDKGSPNGQYGVQVDPVGKINLLDYAASQTGDSVAIPKSDGFKSVIVAWKATSDGFAFTSIPPLSDPNFAAIYYYDIASKQTSLLVEAPVDTKTVNVPRAFSPDGKLLLYAVGSADSESIGGPDSKFLYLDVTNKQKVALPADSFGFNQWTRDSKGYVIAQHDKGGHGSIVVHSLANINTPTSITPTNASDLLLDLSTDGRLAAVTSVPTDQKGAIAQIYIMKLDGTSRKALTKFAQIDTSITALVWGNDGIYYSLHTTDKTAPDTIWRMDLDGANATQIGQGTLYRIIGAG
jgi:hypothetical protein